MSDVADIIDELDDHGFEDTSTDRKLVAINDTVTDFCSREPWPFLEGNLALAFTGSAYPSNWPADFSKVLSIIDTSTGTTLTPERAEVIRRSYATSLATVGAPSLYYFKAARANFLPVPASGYASLDMDYLRSHPVLTETSLEAAILIPARHHRVITLGSLYKLYAMEDDPELSALFEEQYENKISRLREDLSRLQYDRPDRIFVLDDDDLDY